ALSGVRVAWCTSTPNQFMSAWILYRPVNPQKVTSSTMPERSPKWEARRQVIVDTSAHLFARNGYHATGIAELCEANDLGKGALYHYIGSKEELLAAIHDRVMEEISAGAERAVSGEGRASEKLARLGEELLEVIYRLPDHVWVFLHDFPALTGERAKQFLAW